MNADYTKKYEGEVSIEEAIPGLSVGIPFLHADASCKLAGRVEGNADALTVEIGLDFCVDLVVESLCASKLDGAFPVWLIKDTLSFSSVCLAR